MHGTTQIITVANLKGGSGKTTTVAHLAAAIAATGLVVWIVDADPQGSALRWSEQAEWAIPTLALPVRNLHAKLAGVVPPGVDIVIIDTPPLGEQRGIVHSCLRVADLALITMAPTMVEFERLNDVWTAIADADDVRSVSLTAAVLLNRTIANARSTRIFRELIEGSGHTVVSTAVPRLEAIAQSFGAPVAPTESYARVADEVLRSLGRA